MRRDRRATEFALFGLPLSPRPLPEWLAGRRPWASLFGPFAARTAGASPLAGAAQLLALTLLAVAWPVLAQDVRVQVATQEPPYYVGEPAVIQFTVEGFDEQPEPTCEMTRDKPTPGLRGQLAETHPSVFSQIVQRNGQLYQAKSVTYRIDYLVIADQPGEHTVGPFVIKQGTKQVRVESLKLKFQAVPADPNQRVRLILPDRPIYPDQRVPVRIEWWYAGDFDDVLKLRIYSPLFDQFRFAPDPPPPRGASRLPIDTKDGSLALAAEVREQALDGKRFTVVTATRTLIPDRVGEFPLAPIIASVRKVTQWARDRSPFGDLDSGFGGSLFRDLMGDRRRPASTELVRASGEPQQIVVQPFPLEGRPASFAGAVGKGFAIDVTADRTVVRVGDPIRLAVTLRGDGNLDNASLPPLSADGGMNPDQFRLPEGEIAGTMSEGSDKSAKPGVSKKPDSVPAKQFQVSVRVTDESVSEIPALAYSWFDPDSQTYQTTRSKPIALRVMPAQVVSAADVVSSPARNPDAAADAAGRKTDSTQVALAGPRQPTFSLSGADLAIEPDAGTVLRDSSGRFGGVFPGLVYAAGLLLLVAAVVDRKRRDIDPAANATVRNVRWQHARIVQAGGLSKQQAAEEIAAAIRALVADLPDVARADADAVIADCEAVAYALNSVGESRLDAGLVGRATAVADRFEEAARSLRRSRAAG
ncbi:MAG: protein BatD [Candidatus Anammoximicrobium sp.]|nr:protein BatD [Candidatus Anammoximicrobium sp.]